MKSTGTVRRIDKFGRLVLPIELRRVMNVEEGDALEIFTEGNAVILKKYEPYCVFCGSMDNLQRYNDRNVCAECARKLGRSVIDD